MEIRDEPTLTLHAGDGFLIPPAYPTTPSISVPARATCSPPTSSKWDSHWPRSPTDDPPLEIAFTENVKEVQDRYGSGRFYARHQEAARGSASRDVMGSDVREFLLERDSFYVATVSETGWPYVPYRGGPPGFLQVLDDHTLGWADFRGNLQYISTGNLSGDDRVALFVMDYPDRQRLKIFGRARVVFVEDDPELVATLTRPDYEAVVERGVVVSVDAFDWNCQQHITPRYTVSELEPRAAALRGRLAALEAENHEMHSRLFARE